MEEKFSGKVKWKLCFKQTNKQNPKETPLGLLPPLPAPPPHTHTTSFLRTRGSGVLSRLQGSRGLAAWATFSPPFLRTGSLKPGRARPRLGALRAVPEECSDGRETGLRACLSVLRPFSRASRAERGRQAGS